MESKKKVVIACGGTGGHLFPGVAVAQEMKRRGHSVRLLISEKKVDAQASAKYGDLEFDTVPAIAKPPTLSPKMLPFLWKMLKTTAKCKGLLKNFEADAVIGMGGFTSLPPVMAGKKLRKCQLTFSAGDALWTTNVDGVEFAFRGMKLPENEEKLDAVSNFQDRMFKIEAFREIFMELFGVFVELRKDKNAWSKTQVAMRTWVRERKTLT